MLNKLENLVFNLIELMIPVIAFMVAAVGVALIVGVIITIALGPFFIIAYAMIEMAKILAG